MRRARCCAALMLSVLVCACTVHKVPPPSPNPPTTSKLPSQATTPPYFGIASWYGPGFNGRRTANGEIYNQEDLTAASPTLPLGSLVAVTNLNNGRSVIVRINDRGPFLKSRALDLSHGAAAALGMVGQGTAPVKIEVLSTPSSIASLSPRYGYYVQVGSFANLANAERLRNKLASMYPNVRIEELRTPSSHYYRVRLEGFATREEALARAREIASNRTPVVIGEE